MLIIKFFIKSTRSKRAFKGKKAACILFPASLLYRRALLVHTIVCGLSP